MLINGKEIEETTEITYLGQQLSFKKIEEKEKKRNKKSN